MFYCNEDTYVQLWKRWEKHDFYFLFFKFLSDGMGSRRQLIEDSEKAIKDKI